MAKHPQKTNLELVTEDPTSPPLSDESRMAAQLDSFLSISEVPSEKGKVEVNNNSRTNGESPSPSKGEGWGEGEHTGKLQGVIIGKVVDINDQGQPLVDFPGSPYVKPTPARSTVHLEKSHLGQDVVLVFDQGDTRKPIIMGTLYSSDNKPPESSKNDESGEKPPTDVEIDGERLTFTAKKEIVLKCGKASITLTKAGKILIRGAYLLSRSSGVNRVKGGSVQIN